jgi:hypothetical protein
MRIPFAIMALAAATLLGFLGQTGRAHANTVYKYSGNLQTETDGTPGCTAPDCFVTGHMSFATPLGANFAFDEVTPVAFSFTDGDITINTQHFTPPFARFFVATDATGAISEWQVEVRRSTPSFSETLIQVLNTDHNTGLCTGGCVLDGLYSYNPLIVGYARIYDSPGTWTSAAPIPPALPLFASAIALLGGIGIRRARSAIVQV